MQALVVAITGTIYAATSPDGKVYKLVHGGPSPGKAPEGSHTTAEVAAAQEGAKPGEKPHPSVDVDPSYTASILFDPKTKYIWALALDRQGQLYIGTGDRGEIFRVDRNGAGSLFFKSDEAQIRALDFDQLGNLLAGTDGSGLIYRISPQGDGFVLYSAPKKEITALAVDRRGNIYAAGVGEKRGAAPSVSTSVASVGIVVTAPAPSVAAPTAPSAPAAPSAMVISAPPNLASLGGSEVYRLSPDGSPKTIWSSREDLVYALVFDHQDRLLAGTGNRGKIYAIVGSEYTNLAEASANQVTAFASAPGAACMPPPAIWGRFFCWAPIRSPRAPTRATSSMRRTSPGGDECKSEAAAIFSSSRAAATWTIPTAIGARGSQLTCKEIFPSPRRPPASSSGRQCYRLPQPCRSSTVSSSTTFPETLLQ